MGLAQERMPTNIICKFWLQGRCQRRWCRFVHAESADSSQLHMIVDKEKKEDQGRKVNNTGQPKQCKLWAKNCCLYGDNCNFVHAWSYGSGFEQLVKLEGHTMAITGIALPPGSSLLYTASKDRSVRAWDCHTGQCTCAECYTDEVGPLINRGTWLFAAMPNIVQGQNLQHVVNVNISLDKIDGQVRSLEFINDALFAGMEDGNILAWIGNPETNSFELVATKKGHIGPVCSLVIGTGLHKLFSGSGDCSIKVWDKNLQCIQTLDGHTREVTSLMCWDRYLLSASLDKTLKVWDATENGTIEKVYEHKQDHGVIAMSVTEHQGNHILLCSLEDKTVRLYNLPSFAERGRVFSKEQVHSIQVGPDGLFFTGDAAGGLSVWRLTGNLQPQS